MIDHKTLREGDVVIFDGVWKNLPPVVSIFLCMDELDFNRDSTQAQAKFLTPKGDSQEVRTCFLYLVDRKL